MADLNQIHKEIINYLVAENEGIRSFGTVGSYMRAFSGQFQRNMPFTFHFLSENRPIMYVYDPRLPDKRSAREVFHRECHRKKQQILEITDFFEYLTEKDYVHRIYQGLSGRPALPNQYDKLWRKYSDFYMDLMSGLSFVCLAVFTPKLKLYRLWEHITTQQIA